MATSLGTTVARAVARIAPGARAPGPAKLAPVDTISTWQLGAAELLRVPYFDIALSPESLSITAADVAASGAAGPPWTNAAGGVAVGQSFWVIRSAGTTTIVDPCGASDAFLRSGPEALRHQEAALAALTAAGISPATVDLVVLTHLDGIGMAAIVDDEGGWSPAFPNATLVVTAAERAHIHDHVNDISGASAFEELAAAGHVDAVEAPHELAPGITLVPTGGHSPGHAVVVIGSGGQPDAVLLGHLALNPVHLDAPGEGLHDDAATATDVVSGWLDHSAEHGTILAGALWPAPGAARVIQRHPLRLEPVAG